MLTDRGLESAVSALTSRSAVPVKVALDLPDELPAQVEAAAYYVIAEALTNVTKYAQATVGRGHHHRRSRHDPG